MCVLTVVCTVNMSEKGKKNKNAGKNDKQTNKKGEKPKKPNDAKPPPKYEKVPEKIIPKDDSLNKTAVPQSVTDNVDSNSSQRSKYSRRKIESNWSRLELPENIYDKMEETFHGADFKELLKKPISIGDHFQFKHEKFWNFTSIPINSNDNFILDLNKLTDHVLCTPFFKRNDLDSSLFSDEQLQHMKNLAESHKMSLDMKSSDGEKSDSVSDPVNLSSDDIDFDDDLLLHNYLSKSLEISSVPRSTTNLKTVQDDELDELLDITPNILTTKNDSIIPSVDFKNPIPNTEENLEEWLDDFLGS